MVDKFNLNKYSLIKNKKNYFNIKKKIEFLK
jgi:hypothetical protein